MHSNVPIARGNGPCIQQKVPELARQHPFLMHDILAQAALHLSWLRLAQQQHYSSLATRHHGLALPQFCLTLQHLNESNYDALLAYSFSLVWCAFATRAAPLTDEGIRDKSDMGRLIPEWFSLLRGACLIIRLSRPWIVHSSQSMPRIPPPAAFLQSSDHLQLTALSARLTPIVVSPLCVFMLSAIHHAFSLAFMQNHDTPMRNPVNFWIGSLPTEFTRLLSTDEPWALVIMAHFCILINRSETGWFMKGHGLRLLQTITGRLNEEWMLHILWPCEEIGFKPTKLATSLPRS